VTHEVRLRGHNNIRCLIDSTLLYMDLRHWGISDANLNEVGKVVDGCCLYRT
jgi:hypothetical protein